MSPDVPENLVQRLAHVLMHAFDLSPAMAVVLAFALAGLAVLGLVAGVIEILSRLNLTKE